MAFFNSSNHLNDFISDTFFEGKKNFSEVQHLEQGAKSFLTVFVFFETLFVLLFVKF